MSSRYGRDLPGNGPDLAFVGVATARAAVVKSVSKRSRER
jgi:hypothetical protein